MLYIVATPIGNLGEITYRAVSVLSSVKAVLCEDTRHSRILLDHYGIKKPLISYQKFSERAKLEPIMARLEAGEDLALISDAGTPLVSDPGRLLLQEAVRRGVPYTTVSGPCAAVAAAVLSGFDLSTFCLCGFLPEKPEQRRQRVRAFADIPALLLFYVAKHDLYKDVAFLASELGARPAALVREISKLHEEVIRFTLGEPLPENLLGEFVIAIEGKKENDTEGVLALTVAQHLKLYLDEGIDKNEAIKRVARERGVHKSEIYKEALNIHKTN